MTNHTNSRTKVDAFVHLMKESDSPETRHLLSLFGIGCAPSSSEWIQELVSSSSPWSKLDCIHSPSFHQDLCDGVQKASRQLEEVRDELDLTVRATTSSLAGKENRDGNRQIVIDS